MYLRIKEREYNSVVQEGGGNRCGDMGFEIFSNI